MGFITMALSAIIGIFFIILGLVCIKTKKRKLWSIAAILIGIILVLIAVWLGLPK